MGAKGLEFDVVVIVEPQQLIDDPDGAVGDVYVSMTRPAAPVSERARACPRACSRPCTRRRALVLSVCAGAVLGLVHILFGRLVRRYLVNGRSMSAGSSTRSIMTIPSRIFGRS